MSNVIKGIAYLNPIRVKVGYMKRCAEYEISHGVKHFELVGPTHSPIRGNCDATTLYHKYSVFNEDKDVEKVTVKIDRNSASLPFIYSIMIK